MVALFHSLDVSFQCAYTSLFNINVVILLSDLKACLPREPGDIR